MAPLWVPGGIGVKGKSRCLTWATCPLLALEAGGTSVDGPAEIQHESIALLSPHERSRGMGPAGTLGSERLLESQVSELPCRFLAVLAWACAF